MLHLDGFLCWDLFTKHWPNVGTCEFFKPDTLICDVAVSTLDAVVLWEAVMRKSQDQCLCIYPIPCTRFRRHRLVSILFIVIMTYRELLVWGVLNRMVGFLIHGVARRMATLMQRCRDRENNTAPQRTEYLFSLFAKKDLNFNELLPIHLCKVG